MTDNKIFTKIVLQEPDAADVKRVADSIARNLVRSLNNINNGNIFKPIQQQLETTSKTADQTEKSMDRLAKSQARLVAQLLPANDAFQRQARILIRQQQQLGATSNELLSFARSTGVFSDEILDAIANVVRLTGESAKLQDELQKGMVVTEKLGSTTQKLNSALKEVSQQTTKEKQTVQESAREKRRAEQATVSLARAQARLVAQLLPANDATQKSVRSLLNQRAAAGSTATEILELARKTEAFSNEQLEAVTRVAKLRSEIDNLVREFSRTGQGSDSLRSKFSQLGKEIDQIDKQSQRSGKSLVDLGSFLRQVGAIVSALGLVDLIDQIVEIGRSSLRASVEFESGLAGVAKTTEGIANELGELTALGEQVRADFRRLAEDVPIALADTTQIGELAGQLGIAQDNLIQFTELIGRIGATSDLGTEDAAKELARFQNILNLTQDGLERFASSVIELGNNSATTESEIVSFSKRIAGASAVAGLSASEIAGVATAFTSVGVEIEAGGTAFQRFILRLNEAVASGGEDLERFAALVGQTPEQFAQLFQTSPAEAFIAVIEGISASGNDAITVLKDLELSDQRLVRAILSLANAGSLLRDSIELSNEAFEENTALLEESELRFQTTESAVTKLQNSWENFLVTIGDSAPIESTANALATVLNVINEINDNQRIRDSLSERINTALGNESDRPLSGDIIGATARRESTGELFPSTLASDEQIQRLEIIATLLERFSEIPDFPPPSNEDEWRALVNVIEETAGGVEAFIIVQKLANSDLVGTEEQFQNLARAIAEGRIALEDLPQAFQAVISGQQQVTEAQDQYVSSTADNATLQEFLLQNYLRQIGVQSDLTTATDTQTLSIEEQTEAIEKATRLAEIYNEALVESISTQIQANGSSNEYSAQLIQTVAELGATSEQIIELTKATGLLSDEQIEAAVNAAEFAQKEQEVSEALLAGQITAESAIAITEAYATKLLQQSEAAEKAAMAETIYRDQLLASISAQISASDAADDYTSELVNAAAESGATSEQIIALVRATNLLSEEQISATIRSAEFAVKQNEVLESLRNNEISAEEAAISVVQYANSLGIAADEANRLSIANREAFASGFVQSITDTGSSSGGRGQSERLRTAREQVKAAEAQVKAAEAQVDAAQDTVDALEKRVRQTERERDILKEQADLLEEEAKLAEDLAEKAQDIADEAAEFSQDLTDQFVDQVDAILEAQQKLSEARSELDQAIAEGDEDDIAKLREEVSDLEAELAAATDVSDSLGETLFKVAAASGASISQVIALGVALGTLSEEQAQAALTAIAAQQAIESVARAYVNGQISADQAAEAVGILQDQISAGEAIDLTSLGIDVSTPDQIQDNAKALQDQANAAKEAAAAAEERAEAAQKDVEASQEQIDALKDQVEAAKEIVEAEKDKVDILRESVEAAREVAEAAREAEQSFGGAAKETRNWTAELLKIAEEGGAGAKDLLEIAMATGDIDENMAKSAISAGLLQSALATLGENVGDIGGGFAANQLTSLETALSNVEDFISSQDLAVFVDIALSDDALSIEDITEALELIGASEGEIPVEVALELAKGANGEQIKQAIVDLQNDVPPVEVEVKLTGPVVDEGGSQAIVALTGENNVALDAVEEIVEAAETSEAIVTITGENAGAVMAVEDVTLQANESTGTVTIDGNNELALASVSEVEATANATTGTVDIDADDSLARQTIQEFENFLNARQFTLDVDVNVRGEDQIPSGGSTTNAGTSSGSSGGGSGGNITSFHTGGVVGGGGGEVLIRALSGEGILPLNIMSSLPDGAFDSLLQGNAQFISSDDIASLLSAALSQSIGIAPISTQVSNTTNIDRSNSNQIVNNITENFGFSTTVPRVEPLADFVRRSR